MICVQRGGRSDAATKKELASYSSNKGAGYQRPEGTQQRTVWWCPGRDEGVMRTASREKKKPLGAFKSSSTHSTSGSRKIDPDDD